MRKKFRCRFFGHHLKLWSMSNREEKAPVYVCLRCDKVSGIITFPCEINFDELEPCKSDEDDGSRKKG